MKVSACHAGQATTARVTEGMHSLPIPYAATPPGLSADEKYLVATSNLNLDQMNVGA